MSKPRGALVLFVLACATKALAQGAPVAEAIVPVTGSVAGLRGVEWRTDVAIRNTQANDVEVVLSLLGAPDDPFLFTTLAAGQSMTFRDVSRQTFGLTGRLAPLRVQTVGAVSVDVAAVVWGMTAKGPTEPQVLTVQYGRFRPMLQTLPSVSIGEQFRTNVGLVNPSENPATVVLALQKVAGRNIGVTTQTLPPHGHIQLPLQSLFPLLTEGDNLSLVVEHTNPEAYVYASVIANETNSARYYGPR